LAEVKNELRQWSDAAVAAGIARERLVIDPGFGFGKRFDENYPAAGPLQRTARAWLAATSGTSRQIFYWPHAPAPTTKTLRLTSALWHFGHVIASVLQGAHIVRVHDVRQAVEAVKVADAVLCFSPERSEGTL